MRTAIIVLLFGATAAFAQMPFEFHCIDTVQSAAPTFADVEAAGYIVNTGTAPLNLVARRTQNDIPSVWSTAMCFQICMAPFIDTVGAYNVAPGDSQLFLLHFYTDDTARAGNVTIDFHLMDDSTVHTVAHFAMRTDTVTRFTYPVFNQLLGKNMVNTIRWTTPLTGMAILEYSTDAGTKWKLVDTAVDLASQSYQFNPHNDSTNVAKLRFRTAQGHFISDMFRVKTVTAVAEPATVTRSFDLSPNPSSGVFTVRPAAGDTRQVVVRDLLGRIVASMPAHGTDPVPVDVSSLPKGTYYVVCRSVTGASVSPVVIR